MFCSVVWTLRMGQVKVEWTYSGIEISVGSSSVNQLLEILLDMKALISKRLGTAVAPTSILNKKYVDYKVQSQHFELYCALSNLL